MAINGSSERLCRYAFIHAAIGSHDGRDRKAIGTLTRF
jgi:hypothetical protein